MSKQIKRFCTNLALTTLALNASAPSTMANETASAALSMSSNARIIKEFHCQSTLQQVMLDLGRQAGFTAMVDDELKSMKVEGDYIDLTGVEILKLIAAKYKLSFEEITPGTIFVNRGGSADGTGAQSAAPIAKDSPTKSAPAVAVLEGSAEQGKYVPELKESKKNILLQGGIEHHESLSAVPLDLRAGAQISTAKMKAMEAMVPDNLWSRLPNWAAGTWKTQSSTGYYRYSYQYKSKDFDVNTFMDKSAETLGHLKDRKGDLWAWERAHYWVHSESERYFVLHFNRETETKYKDETQFTIHFISTRVLVDKTTKRIAKTYQVEAIQTYTYPEKNVIKCKASIKDFDENGLPVLLQKSISYQYKIAEYQPWTHDRGEDLRKLFKQYLTMHGLSNLIPAD